MYIYEPKPIITDITYRAKMKTSTLLGLILVGVLTVSWTAAEPYPEPKPEPEPDPQVGSYPSYSLDGDGGADSYETGNCRRKRDLQGGFHTSRG